MKIILVGGFLGSGKTTFIRHLAAFLVLDKGQRVVVLGEVSIDDQFLARQGFKVKGIFGGCICCQLTGDLVIAVNQIAEEMAPDCLIIETTGLARPDAVLNTLRTYARGRPAVAPVSTVVLVDAGRWQELVELIPDLLFAQIAAADLLMVNKVDELEGSPEGMVARLRRLNGRARIVTGCARTGLDHVLFEELGSYV